MRSGRMIGRRDTLVALAGAALGVVASPASTARGDGLRFIRRSALDASAGAVLVDKSCRLEAIGAATGLASHAL